MGPTIIDSEVLNYEIPASTLHLTFIPTIPISSVPSEQYREDSAGSIPASLLEEQIRQRSSIVFNIDEDDYLVSGCFK